MIPRGGVVVTGLKNDVGFLLYAFTSQERSCSVAIYPFDLLQSKIIYYYVSDSTNVRRKHRKKITHEASLWWCYRYYYYTQLNAPLTWFIQ